MDCHPSSNERIWPTGISVHANRPMKSYCKLLELENTSLKQRIATVLTNSLPDGCCRTCSRWWQTILHDRVDFCSVDFRRFSSLSLTTTAQVIGYTLTVFNLQYYRATTRGRPTTEMIKTSTYFLPLLPSILSFHSIPSFLPHPLPFPHLLIAFLFLAPLAPSLPRPQYATKRPWGGARGKYLGAMPLKVPRHRRFTEEWVWESVVSSFSKGRAGRSLGALCQNMQ